jgi:hypothetical protein
MKRHSVRVFFIVTLTTLSSWAVTDAQAQNAIKLFGAAPVTVSAPCQGPLGCDPVNDRTVFDEATLVLSCKGRPSAVLSSTADGRGRLVVDNFIEVNGVNACAGGASAAGVENCFNDPVFAVVGTPALDAYQSVPPIDVSRLMPHGARATVNFSLVDFGGIYANSELWLVTNCTTSRRVDICHKPGTRAEHVITVSQSAVSGHLGHGDTIDLSACRPFQRPMR